jgi:phage shock protein A
MGLFQRISDLLRSNINDLISRAEDPEKLLNAANEEMQKQIIEAKSRVAMSIADEKRLQKHYESQVAKAADWEKKAMSAVRAARDDLAVEALAKKKEHQKAASQFEDQLDSQRAAVDELKKALTELTSKLDETKRKRQILLARAKRAEAQRHVAATLAAAGESSAYERLEKLEAKIERAEAEAEATWEVASLSSGSRDKDLSDEIKMLDAGDLGDDLAELKGKMRDMGMLELGAEVKALPSGGPDDDLEDPAERERNARKPPEGRKTDPELSLVTEEP